MIKSLMISYSSWYIANYENVQSIQILRGTDERRIEILYSEAELR